MKFARLFAALCLTATLFVGGCNTTAINKNAETSFLTADDLVAMTDKMAQSIVGDPDVAAITRQKPMIIVVKPIANETNEIIRGNQKELYVARLRGLLATKQALRTQFTWVLNKADYQKLQVSEGMSAEQLGPDEGRIQPEYALWGTFYAATDAGGKHRTDTYLCVYRLTKLSGPDAGLELWTDKYETKKSIKKEFLD